MNVYDFDGTIFVPDSSYCFVLYCMRHYPRAVFKVLPGTLWQFILYLRAGRKDAGKLKESLFSFLSRVDNIDRIVHEFWAENYERMEDWYLEQKPEICILSMIDLNALIPSSVSLVNSAL